MLTITVEHADNMTENADYMSRNVATVAENAGIRDENVANIGRIVGRIDENVPTWIGMLPTLIRMC